MFIKATLHKATRRLLASDLVILSLGQETRAPELAPSSTTYHITPASPATTDSTYMSHSIRRIFNGINVRTRDILATSS
ncbi:hypothetical protein TNCV_1687461 [Trichonephila clavipes]|nr:hypothetical protein TNCV_1687461 [Trichonephila clavipes]